MKCLKTTHQLPIDVILDILVWLPAKFVLRFRCVCKEWYNLIDVSVFANLHLSKSLEPNSLHNRILLYTRTFCMLDDLHYHPVRVTKFNWPEDTIRDDECRHTLVGSCHGLVCFRVIVMNDSNYKEWTVKSFLIFNPTTRAFKLILPSLEKKWKNYSLSYGFGYDSDHDDYKIVVTSRVWTEIDRDVRIYSLKADLWSCHTPPTPVTYGRSWENRQKVIFRNKMLHYLASAKLLGDGRHGGHRDYRIVRFDITSENWKDDLSLPVQVKDRVKMGELDGWLYLHVDNYHPHKFSHDLWIMEEHGSWKLMFHFPRRIKWHHLVIARSKEGRNRLLLADYGLFWHDQRDNTKVHFKLEALPRDRSGIVCIASLVAIPGCSFTKLQEIKD